MHITRVIVTNYRCLRFSDLKLNPQLNIIVGNNECGKSTLLEAVNLALTGQLNGRPIQSELHPHLFNAQTVQEYLAGLKAKSGKGPPSILIELYFDDDPALVTLKGTINSQKADVAGLSMAIEFNSDYADEFTEYVKNPDEIRTLPVEYYKVSWRSFADGEITGRSVPVKPSFIDASIIRNNSAANRYVVDIMRDSLSKSDKVALALSYRMMKDVFLKDERVKSVNDALVLKKGDISDKELTVSLDTSSRSSWEIGVMPHLDEVPLTLVGKGEQNAIKIKLALQASADRHLIMIEEPENHLSFSNLNTLINHVSERRENRQLLITTHSSFVLNKLGVESVILFSLGTSATLKALTPGTHDYFMRLPGHDTLRLILSKRPILVEGPSDELIVQAAYKMKHGKLPLEDGRDVISVNSLAFKRFLEIAEILQLATSVVTDNDGDVSALKVKYKDYLGKDGIDIYFDEDEGCPTLEPQLIKANGRAAIENMLGKTFLTDEDLLAYMTVNKTDTALQLFNSTTPWKVPGYVADAIA